MSVTLRKRENKDGTISLLLDIYHNGRRTREFLKHLKLVKPSNKKHLADNKDRLNQAEAIAIRMAGDLSSNDYNMVSDSGKKTLVIVWMEDYIRGYTKGDKRNLQGAVNRFKDFLIEEKNQSITFNNLTPLLIEDFMDYLQSKSVGEGALSYFARFKKIIKHAYRKNLMPINPLDKVEKKIKGKARKKDTLTLDEIQTLTKTKTENPEIKRAFLFCCFTGLRWIDVKHTLKWGNIDLKNKEMNLIQQKTNEHLTMPLNAVAIQLLGKAGDKESIIFTLPSANGANKTLKAWVKRAEIDKTITWHNGRHSFGTNLIYNNVDLLTASKLLGHTTVKHAQRYVDTAKKMKEDAVKSINVKLKL